MRKRTPLKEEKIANKISELLSAVDLDLDDVGFYLAHSQPKVHYNRLVLIAESAIAEQERINDRINHNTLF